MKLKEQLAIEYINSAKYYKSGSYPSDRNVMEAYIAGFERCREMANTSVVNMIATKALEKREILDLGEKNGEILDLGEEEAR